ncbi:uncharacterized protein TRIADDRAFT_30625 [Trichoplax adhaerens]|uniref:Thioredoxin-like protein 1 n=1 Tax=Trichoplax adhaerens TaxID=10228 RepID=B3S7S6_TRIAD|nr:hypothetical protein TRIADDRAFT_30625 [Trichoplax adhaerens]EDV21248.1 hypothetical protein TRIADDRAFT_30625 [Trichoplax adhaerens]|eukprot:XP_002116215.1 hypothetical protein TRIADDRAFT_30625 [Trichoplax adhaerens]
MASSSVITCNSDVEFEREFNKAGEKLLVVDFTATWCGPCRQMAPIFAALSNKYKGSTIFLSVDIDKCQNTAEAQGIRSVPTFRFFKNKARIDEVSGSQAGLLEEKIKQHGGSSNSSSSSTNEHESPVNLYSAINLSNCECLNENDDHPFKNALTKSALYLESDCDEQLLIYIAFQQPVKIHSIILNAPDDGRAPKIVKLFTNQTVSLDFDKAEAKQSTQQFELTGEDVSEGNVINLRYVKFQNVENITLFVKNNQGGDDITVINHLAFIGNLIDKTDMSSFKRVAGKPGESH